MQKRVYIYIAFKADFYSLQDQANFWQTDFDVKSIPV